MLLFFSFGVTSFPYRKTKCRRHRFCKELSTCRKHSWLKLIHPGACILDILVSFCPNLFSKCAWWIWTMLCSTSVRDRFAMVNALVTPRLIHQWMPFTEICLNLTFHSPRRSVVSSAGCAGAINFGQIGDAPLAASHAWGAVVFLLRQCG